MAEELTQDAVLVYLQSRGGSVPNADLLLHFRPFLREHADRQRNRELFKSFVNSVARVKQEDGVSHVVLQRRFRGHCQGLGSGGSKAESTQRNVHLSPLWNADRSRNKSPEPKGTKPGPVVLPAAGIVLSNNNDTVESNLNKPQHKVQLSHAPGAVPQAVLTSAFGRSSEPATAQPVPVLPREHPGLPDTPSGRDVKAVPMTPPELREPALSSGRPSPQPHSLPGSSVLPVYAAYGAPVSPGQALNNNSSSMPRQSQLSSKPVPPHVSVSVSEALSPSLQPAREPRTIARHRQSYRSALSLGDDDDDEVEEKGEEVVVPERRASASFECAAVRGMYQPSPAPIKLQGPWTSEGPHGTGLRQTPPSQPQVTSERACLPQLTSERASLPQMTSERASLPQMASERAVSPHMTSESAVLPQMTSEGASPPQITSDRAVLPQATSERAVPQIHIQDMDQDSRRRQEPQPRFRTGFPLPIHNLYGSSSSVVQTRRGGGVSSGWSSCEELTRSSDLHNYGADNSAVSVPSPPTLQRSVVARRQSSNLKRMCVSVGADLDQLMDEDDKRGLGGSEAARLQRLHLISSSLSLRHMSSMSSLSSLSSCPTPPRSHSLADLTDRDLPSDGPSTQSSPQHHEGSSRQSQVPLEEREHLWLVKAASGMWPDIYSLFREDPSLLHRQDFMSGFTVLHWIAKHGDHRVLNTLWYGVEKAGLMFNTDAQSSCGYTSLHIAAIHNHKNIIRLLVNKFKANVSLRDAAGRKAWFYLPAGAPPDLFQLLGAPAKAALGPAAGQTWATPQTHPQTHRRRRPHRFSSASGQRPKTFSGDAKVKRSSSLAVFLKHKSLQKVKAEWAI